MAIWYVTQNGAGAANGHDLADAWSNSQLGGAAGAAVAAGDTVIINGTMSGLNIPSGNGTVGNPITIVWAPGARISSPASRLCFVNNKQNYVFDGQGGGVMECTANGSLLANQVSVSAFDMSQSTNFTFKNIIFQNLYVHVPYPIVTDTIIDPSTAGAVYANPYKGSLIVQNCSFNNIGWCLTLFGNPAANLTVTGCWFSNYDHGIGGVAGTASGAIGQFIASGNRFGTTAVWDTGPAADKYHHDGIHTFWAPGSGGIANAIITNNYFDGDWGLNNTAHLFMEGNTSTHASFEAPGWLIANNVHLQTPGNLLNDGFIAGGGVFATVAHNTYLGQSVSGSRGFVWGGSGLTFVNNVIVGVDTFINSSSTFAPGGLNNNLYAAWTAAGGNAPFIGLSSYNTLAAWQTATGQDGNSTQVSSVLINPDGTIPVNSTLRSAGTLIALAPFDFSGHGRPNPPSIGAHEYYQVGLSAGAHGAAVVVAGP